VCEAFRQGWFFRWRIELVIGQTVFGETQDVFVLLVTIVGNELGAQDVVQKDDGGCEIRLVPSVGKLFDKGLGPLNVVIGVQEPEVEPAGVPANLGVCKDVMAREGGLQKVFVPGEQFEEWFQGAHGANDGTTNGGGQGCGAVALPHK